MIHIKELKAENCKAETHELTIQGKAKAICEDVLAIVASLIDPMDSNLQTLIRHMLMIWIASEDAPEILEKLKIELETEEE